ncbi:MAG: TolB family protein [Cyanobacteriota bacterium]
MSRPEPRRCPSRCRPLLVLLSLTLGLGGCFADQPQPLDGLNRQLEASGSSSRAPSLSSRWLALITTRDNRQILDLIDLTSGRPVPVPGLNRPDAQPLAVSVDDSGRRLALIRQRDGSTELLLHRVEAGSNEPIPIHPAGVPEGLGLSADGRTLAVQVSRQGRHQIDLITLP